MEQQIRVSMLTKRELLALLCLVFGVALFNIIRSSSFSSDEIAISSVILQQREKIVTRVLVQRDDTLWGYASQYYSKEYENVEELVSEIKRTNGLSDDLIKEGSYLLIPHYVTSKEDCYYQ